jgi:hypothetical protein
MPVGVVAALRRTVPALAVPPPHERSHVGIAVGVDDRSRQVFGVLVVEPQAPHLLTGSLRQSRRRAKRPEGWTANTYRICMPEIARAITRRWISAVPSKIV